MCGLVPSRNDTIKKILMELLPLLLSSNPEQRKKLVYLQCNCVPGRSVATNMGMLLGIVALPCRCKRPYFKVCYPPVPLIGEHSFNLHLQQQAECAW